MLIQWLGHSAFKVVIGEARVLFDPFLTGNPTFKGDVGETIKGTTHVLLTHGHNDHFGDTIAILKQTGATLISTPELCGYVASVASEAKTQPMNIGGSAQSGAISISMVRAYHSSSYAAPDGKVIYGGMPAGLIVKASGRSVYHMGDTAAYSDMALVNELHRPEIGIVPIGDNYTMGPDEAALAVNRWFDFKTVIPCHYGTFPVLVQTPEAFKAKVSKGAVWAPTPMGSREF
ncbi:MAG TPA: metal-dependent hydrolase [Roseiarcus sp.]|jgi:L-ascorbate metabolism protein UlaG (beta-lactamase superfamily)|nr:metal-dependent hydrolase [Roseiarcus sp.]